MNNIKKIQEKYSSFFNSIKEKKLEYKINKNGLINIFNNMKSTKKEEIIFLPENIEYIPSNTKFHGHLIIQKNHQLSSIGKKVIVYGDMEISYCNNLKSIGKGLCAESFNTYECDNFKKIPDYTRIKKGIWLRTSSNIQEFGKKVKAQTLIILDENTKDCSVENIESLKIKNIENLKVKKVEIFNNLKLNNLNKIKKLKEIICYKPISKENEKKLIDSFQAPEKAKTKVDNYKIILDFETNEFFLKTIKRLGYTSIYHNYLSFESPNSFCSKLLNEEYDLITEKEIQKYANIKEFLIGENKIPVSMIDYCISQEGILYIKKIGYEFTEEELNKITDPKIKSYYEKQLIKTETKSNIKKFKLVKKAI